MTDHLPECRDALIPDFHNERWICTCPALRACEATVRADEHRALITHGALTNLAGYREGYAAGVQAARDAVAGLPWDNSGAIDPVDALAAIDALRGEW